MSFWSSLSVVMIARDAAGVIEAALASVPAEAETLVAVAESADDTAARALAHGARVIDQDQVAVRDAGGNYDVARNAAMAAARRDWILVLDADERVTAELAAEIAALREPIAHAAFTIPRRNLFWGRPVRLLGEDRQPRLVRAGRGSYEGRALHHAMRVEGTQGRLMAPLLHENLRGLGDLVGRWRRDLPLEAATGASSPRPHHLFRYYYVANGSWRDGWRGLVVSALYALRPALTPLARRS